MTCPMISASKAVACSKDLLSCGIDSESRLSVTAKARLKEFGGPENPSEPWRAALQPRCGSNIVPKQQPSSLGESNMYHTRRCHLSTTDIKL